MIINLQAHLVHLKLLLESDLRAEDDGPLLVVIVVVVAIVAAIGVGGDGIVLARLLLGLAALLILLHVGSDAKGNQPEPALPRQLASISSFQGKTTAT